MRLLKVNLDGSFSLTSIVSNKIPRYAILSHTWEADDQEVTFRDLVDGLGESKAGYRKIRFCGQQANLDGIQYFWIDSCCIDKSSSAELAEAINSMFRWYQNAVKCYVYLSDVPTADFDPSAFRQSRWFTRGWTLQELLAPRSVEFFSREGRQLGDKQSLELQIHQITRIPAQALQQVGRLSQFSVEERMSWTSKRETTIEEDQAYCLLGIFDVYLPLIYGEGREHAFRRLRKEISTGHARDAHSGTDASAAEKYDTCLSNLVATDQTQFLSQTLSRSRHACAWILKNQKYIYWHKSEKSSLLWIIAKAGCGKTTMAAHICQMISLHQTPEAVDFQNDKPKFAVLYFFFQKSNHKAVTTAPAALRTLIRQLVRQVPAVLPILLKRHDFLSAKGDFEWSWENLSSVFGEMLEQTSLMSGVYIIFDALDECEADSRMLILDWMKGLVDVDENASPTTFRSSRTILKILVTSRPDSDMIDHLSGSLILEITDAETKNDIRALIHSRMEDFASQRHLKPDVTRSIIQFLESNAHGMFLWVVLIMKDLERRDERLSDEAIALKLSSTPLTLIDTYEAILHNAPPTRKQDMWRIIRWLLFGSRSLTLAELETGLCLETGISSWHDFAGDLKFLCGSLTRMGGPLEEVNFVHQTARDFFETYSRNSSAADVNGLNLDFQAANEHLAAICVQYLLREETFLGLNQVSLRVRSHPAYVEIMQEFLGQRVFLRYAIQSWAFHARSLCTPSSAISTLIRRLLSSPTRRDNIMTITYFVDKNMGWNIPFGQTPLHLAAYFNIPWLSQMYISENRSSVHATTNMLDTPLIWASEMGSTECVKRLLAAGADPNAFEIDGWSALHWAARNGHPDVATLLLAYGASLDHRDGRGHTPLHWAVDREYWDVAAVLVCWSDNCRLGRIGSTSQLQELREKIASMHTQNTRQLSDRRDCIPVLQRAVTPKSSYIELMKSVWPRKQSR
ncbi:hypothetical protein GJ744_003401 [Endocarpon pusillum]|uniref:NACHT domain-containing protein n=1 Tax=Endocarpon pusillum TaxID=364733 RepID=A0A8H7A9P8_9EURO|nr:hypothetical protein GJ744_003401 [Endocarpon pusillum]